MPSAHVTAGERDFNMVCPFSDLGQLRSENGNFCRVSVTVGLMLSTNQSDTSNTRRIVFSLSKYRLFYATTKETMAGTRPQVVDSIVTGYIFLLFPSHFFFRLPR